MSVEAEPDEVAASQRNVAIEGALLGHGADLAAGGGGGTAADRDGARRRREQPQEDADERGLAGAVRSQHGHELARMQVEAEIVPEQPRPEPQAERAHLDDRRRDRAHRSSARSSETAWRNCHCWNVSPGGSVSVTPTTGIPAARAAASIRAVMGEVVWLL